MSTGSDEISRFSLDIEELVWQNDVSYMDAIIMFCESKGLEVELAAKLISPSLRTKIEIEAEGLNLIPKSNTARLPV